MGNERRSYQIPERDPVTGGELYISELAGDESGITIRGRFELPRYCRLNTEQMAFMEAFLRNRGVISSVERELGISYPTVKSRLDALLETLELAPPPEDEDKRKKTADRAADKKRKILEQLERGEISADEAKAKLRGGKK
jgi:hypothetical protein